MGATPRFLGATDIGAGPPAGQPLNFRPFGEVECILDINAKITDCTLNLRVAEQSRVIMRVHLCH